MSDQNVTGLRELNAFLQVLPVKIEKNILRSALRAGGNVIKNEARANVPVAEGALKKSVRVTTSSNGGVVKATVKAGGKKAPHAHLVEFGTRPHKILPKNAAALAIAGAVVSSVDHPGARPNPFMRPALDSKHTEAVAAIAEQTRKRLTAEGLNTPAPYLP
jgi:HK97 gp10 family phage protein